MLVSVFVLSALLELVGVGLVVQVSVRAGRSLREFQSLNPEGHREGSYAQLSAVNRLVEQILSDQSLAWWAVLALVGGILLGLVGNLISLS